MRGFSAPLLLFVLVALFGIGGFAFVRFYNEPSVKGTSDVEVQPGFKVLISSPNESWDLFRFLCKSESECLESLDSGIRQSKQSGGPTPIHEINIFPQDSWKDYKLMKVYARKSLSLTSEFFALKEVGSVPGSFSKIIPFGSDKVDVVLIPLEPAMSGFYSSAVFSDNL